MSISIVPDALNAHDVLDLFKLVLDVAVLPALAMIYSVQGRLSRIEGQLNALLPLISKQGK